MATGLATIIDQPNNSNEWPESFEVAGVKFALTEVEDEVMGVYFPD
jgi:hypothetical protein